MQFSQKSARLLFRLFNVRPSEWPRVLLLFLMSFLTNAGGVWGLAIVYAAFLKQVGVEALPAVLVLSSISSIMAIAIYTVFVDRIAHERVQISIFAVQSIGIVIGLGVLWRGYPKIAYPFLYLLLLSLAAVIIPHQITYINSFYHTRSAKRILPVVTAGYRTGSIVAGLTMPLLTVWLDAEMIIVVWLLTHMAVMGLTWLMPYILRDEGGLSVQPGYASPLASKASAEQPPSYLENVREGFRYITQSTYLRWMAVGTLLMMVLMALLEYRSSQLLLIEYGTTEDLANFIGTLVGVANIFILLFLLFGLSRLIAWLGLANASLLFPAGNLIICGGLITLPGLVSASAAYLDRTAFRRSFREPIDSLLYNAVPLRVKGRARAFVSGLIEPVGILVGGLLLLLPLTPKIPWLMSTLIGVLAVAYMGSAFVIRRRYSQALLKMLEQEDYSFLLAQEVSDLTITDPATLNQLQKKLEASPSPEFTMFMAQLISQVGGNEAISILERAARTATDARTRSAIVEVLIAAGMRGKTTRQLYTDLLADSAGQVRRSAIVGLEQLVGPDRQAFLALALKMLSDPEVEVRTQVLPALLRANDPAYQIPAAQTLNAFLNSHDAHQRARGLRVLNQVCDPCFIDHLVKHLADPADEVRLEAALTIETLSNEKMPVSATELILTHMAALLQDPIERVRQAALVVLGRLGAHETHQTLVGALTDASPQVRAVAADVLVQIGKAAIPVVHPQLDSPDLQLRKMATIILSRIDRREFGSLVTSQIIGNLLLIYGNYSHLEALHVYAKYPGISVLQSALREQNQQFIDEIFYLLSAIHDPSAIKTVTESLRSETVRVRANAVEALESLTSPETARLIVPLFEPDLASTQLLSFSQEAWDVPPPNTVKTIKQLVADPETPWLLRAMMTFALGEIGANLHPQKQETEHQSRRPRPADLLGALVGAPADTTPQAPAETQAPEQPTPLADTLMDINQAPPVPPSDGLTLPEIEAMLENALADPVADVRLAAQVARQMLAGQYTFDLVKKEGMMLSVVEKIIFLKEVPFFQGMTINQLEVLANVCEEELFEEDARIFNQGDPGGALYVVVNGRVGIEREGARKGSTVRLTTLGPHAYFGEMTLFDDSPRSAMAIALQDTLTLRLRREPLIALARQHPDLSLELINVLSQRLREADDHIAQLTRTRPRELQKLFDKLD
jgi:CRP-like cAMP-binding protein/HEAT repeat protein